jgi:DNA end-binding protein Ku
VPNVARAIWSGVVAFGLVSVPVRLYTATEAHEPTFHQFQSGTSDRIRYQRVNQRTGQEVQYADIVKGVDVGGGDYVMLDREELESVAPGQSRSIDVETFVEADAIDPLHFSKTYFIGPGNDEAKKPYALLRDAMARSGTVAIASLVMRSKEYLAAIRADGDVLLLETLYFADEIRDPHEEIDNLPGRPRLSPQELRMAGQLIDAMSGPWKPDEYRDTYTDRVNELIEAKRDDKEVKPAAEAPEATDVTELTEALRASLAAAKKRPGNRAGGTSGSKRTGGTSRTAAKAGSGKPAKKTGSRAGTKQPARQKSRKQPAKKGAA